MNIGDRSLRLLSGLALFVVLAVILAIFGLVVVEGAGALSWRMLVEAPSSDLATGGVMPAIYGTAACTLLMTVAGVPVGVATAVYLAEYAPRRSRFAAAVRAAVRILAGVPSIVFGLFGLGFFVLFVGKSIDGLFYRDAASPVFGRPALLWSSLTLAVLTLPVVIVTTEEAIRRVPRELREASYALGATQLTTIGRVVLPYARAGILTGVVLAVSRGAGEVAPILFTGVANYLPRIPTDVRDGFMHLGYHVYVLATQAPDVDRARAMVFGTVLVLLVLTFVLDAAALLLRARAHRGTRS
ncbi:phosphate ABC transporter permease PstA [Polyangium sorediatum]|uniref:Phosphate transport system permease protein PstA n=1 Tax=Polyangium sorediatum TaxID=889274 RepID=A0ABT6NSB2_9BACT|nr:phosphate ABC transporter permease PstA [Polyangium sorediatum]MDI1431173.1 phosphate ABC transporter permease PstA [Polyangium sorediatum]